jgi:hypothetical protein
MVKVLYKLIGQIAGKKLRKKLNLLTHNRFKRKIKQNSTFKYIRFKTRQFKIFSRNISLYIPY